ncbi:ABC transporter substrate-binding protein [Allorhizobium sp. BGMRC 0089]|uniref:ABC transporter substrate-binding protein n=1 Tax=Allorhizobium sonneratiae TaxID=2934936 RepID=UPI0020337136|nr:ABC transporter substrate-binding protein [Allorhizobium sonneratiae]MCM2292319.1 ABC transporter substrate-binding protein [Allorhizobium sonneratiae]
MLIDRRRFNHLAALAASLFFTASFGPALAEDKPEVTLRYLAEPGSISGYEIAEKLGYFKGTGIKFQRVGYANGGPASLFALASGSVDIGSAATSAVINAIANGNDFVAVFPSNGIDKTTESNFYVLNDSPIHTIKDLAGKTIAVNTLGAHLDYTIREAFHSVGLPENSARLVVVPGPQLEQVLRSKQVDVTAFGYWQKTFEGAALKGGGLRKVFGDTDVLGDIAGGFIVLRRDWIVKHPVAARDFVEQSERAFDYSRTHLPETRQLIADILKERGENPQIAQYFTGFGLPPGAKPTPRDLSFWIDIFVREGKLKPDQLKVDTILYSPDHFTGN